MRKISGVTAGVFLTAVFFTLSFSFLRAQQTPPQSSENPLDTNNQVMLQSVVVTVTLPHNKTPMAMTNLSADKIAPLNNGQDMPYLLRFTPSIQGCGSGVVIRLASIFPSTISH
jgi:hypothetical protein